MENKILQNTERLKQSFSKPEDIQNQSTTNIFVKILFVDPIRRVALVAGDNAQRYWAKFPNNLTNIDLPPQGEDWYGYIDINKPEIILTHIVGASSPLIAEELIFNDSNDFKSDFRYEYINNTNSNYRTYNGQESNKNFRVNKPKDAIPGDLGFWGIDGNFFGVLRGRLNISKVSPLVQWFQSAWHRLTRIVSENLEIYTGWGDITIKKGKNGNETLRIEFTDNNKKKRNNEFDAILEVGECTGTDNFISFKMLHKEKMSRPITFTVNKNGEVAYSVPDIYTKKIAKDEIKGVGNNSTEIVGQIKKIEGDGGVQIYSNAGAGSLQLGASSSSPNDAFVKKPHLDKYVEMIDSLIVVTGMLGLAGDTVKLVQQRLQAPLDKTDITVGK